MDAALLTMVAALLAAVLASTFEQRREGTKTRDKIDENSEAVRGLAVQVAGLAARVTALETGHEHLRQEFAELRRITDKNHAEVTGSLADARERLARMEGYLRINPPSGESEPDH